ncbi:MAG: spermidine synthase [Gammaproteobacteria bacterium]|nr:spermidine synthase [Gammaproteobacteria bacterium]
MRSRMQSRALLVSIGLIAASALAYEILLTRIFALVHWQHLVAVAISLALLGYGASGTALVLAENMIRRRPALAYVSNALLFGVSGLACIAMAQRISFDPYGLSWDLAQIVPLSATFLVLALPFFAAANCIGLVLMLAGREIPRFYGADLIGAGLGAVAVLIALDWIAVEALLVILLFAGIAGAALGTGALGGRPLPVLVAGCAIGLAGLALTPPEVRPAVYKDLHRALATLGGELVAESQGVSGVVSIVDNRQVPARTAPGLSLQAMALPPRQAAVFVDGDDAGTLPASAYDTPSTAFLDDLLSALPYRYEKAPERVAVLDAGTGWRVAQALRSGAQQVTAVEPNRQLAGLVCQWHDRLNSPVCNPQRVDWQVQSARAFMASTSASFDLITLALPGDAAGLDGLRIDHSVTVEAVSAYLARLSDSGILAIEGPTRTPPRLSMRMLATARDALQRAGVAEPSSHIAMLRGWQRFLLLVSPAPLTDADRAATRAFSRSLGFDLVWLPGMRPEEANRYQQLRRPVFHEAAQAVLDRRPTAGPALSGQPVIDDAPYPHLSTRWHEAAIGLLTAAAEQRAQLDVGVVLGVVTLAIAGLAALVFILMPLLLLRRLGGEIGHHGMRWRSVAHFALIGAGFLLVEIAWIDRLQLFLGHPVYATTAVLASFLVFAGFGSLWSQRQPAHGTGRRMVVAVTVIAVACVLYVTWVPRLLDRLADLDIALRIGVVAVLLAPLAFAMGIPFPTGLRHLSLRAPGLVPWAWGINGSASVVAAAATPLLGSEIGFSGLILVAAGSYLLLPLVGLLRA